MDSSKCTNFDGNSDFVVIGMDEKTMLFCICYSRCTGWYVWIGVESNGMGHEMNIANDFTCL